MRDCVLRYLVIAALLLAPAAGAPNSLPYRFLLVISDQWKAPASYVLEGDGEFPIVAGSLHDPGSGRTRG